MTKLSGLQGDSSLTFGLGIYYLVVKLNRSINRFFFSAVFLSFAWNIFLLIGVILNFSFAHTRAAGGQFADFPTVVRVIYVILLALVVYQAWIFKLIFKAKLIKFVWLPRLFVIVGVIGILLNAVSRSVNERWNVIPAAIISWGFWYYGVKVEKSVL